MKTELRLEVNLTMDSDHTDATALEMTRHIGRVLKGEVAMDELTQQAIAIDSVKLIEFAMKSRTK